MDYGPNFPANQVGNLKKLWVIREYGLWELWVRRESTVWEFEIVSIFVTIQRRLTFLKILMYNFYSTAQCDANTPSFMANGCGLREERPKQISTSQEVGNLRLTL